jgi:hypothetical protein
MKAILVAVGVVASLAVATEISLGGDSIKLTSALIAAAPTSAQPAHPIEPHPGYIAYAEHDVAAPAPGCYWTRLPVYDNARNIVGWLGRPVAVCPAAP